MTLPCLKNYTTTPCSQSVCSQVLLLFKFSESWTTRSANITPHPSPRRSWGHQAGITEVVSSRMTFNVPRKSVIWLKRKLDKHTHFQNKLTPKGKNTHTASQSGQQLVIWFVETNRPLCFHELNHKLLAAPLYACFYSNTFWGLTVVSRFWKERRERERKQLLDDLQETTRYWTFKDEPLDRTLWRTRFWKSLCT